MKLSKKVLQQINKGILVEPLAKYQVKSIKGSKQTYAQSKRVDPQLRKQSRERLQKMLQNIRESTD